METQKRVAIIGGGPAGIVSAKECLAQGLTPTVFEKTGDIGGLWQPQTGGTWEGMRVNISRFTCNFSDFPWPRSTAEFPTQLEMYEYFQRYIEHFSLQERFKFNTNVIKIRKVENNWTITYKYKGNAEETEEFNFVILATGIFSKRFYPEIPGQELFKGRISHSMDYKNPRQIEGDNVLIIGGSFSGAEIASDLCKGGKKVVNVIRNPMWVMSRYHPDRDLNGIKMAFDLVAYKKKYRPPPGQPQVTPQEMWEMKNQFFHTFSNQEEICPDLKVEDFKRPPKIMVTSSYLEDIKAGLIRIKKGEIIAFTKDGVTFKDGTSEVADEIMFSTGYLVDIPFLEQEILDKISFDPKDQIQPLLLYQTVFHPDLPTLAFVGMYKGPYFGILELQARWASLVFSGKQELPSREKMLKGIEEERVIRETVPRLQFPHADYFGFASSLAEEINVLPNYEEIQKTNPELYDKLFNYALIPAHFRLEGVDKNEKVALEQIDEVYELTQKYLAKAKESETKV